MSTLYKRKDGDKFLEGLFTVIEGQVRSAIKDHPGWNLPESAYRSITKRVVGDVAVNWSRLSVLRLTCEPQNKDTGG